MTIYFAVNQVRLITLGGYPQANSAAVASVGLASFVGNHASKNHFLFIIQTTCGL